MERIAMLIVALAVWSPVFWTIFTEDGNRYAQAQRMNVGNCWPSCKPIPVGYTVTTTIIPIATPTQGKDK